MRSRSRSVLNKQKTQKFDKRWYSYALAGAGAVAAAPQAHATIVFTPANTVITGTQSSTGGADFQLDSTDIPNQGGFGLSVNTVGSSGNLFFTGIGTDLAKVLLDNQKVHLFNAGTSIGPAGAGQSYVSHQVKPIEALPTAASLDNFFGLEFNLNGAGPNYGWVEVKRVFNGSTLESVTVEGYAYDTTAGEAIQAGFTGVTPEPGTAALVLLGLGASGLAAWRKRKQAKQAV